MAEPLKLLINADTVRAAGRHLQRVWPAFDRERFEALSLGGLDALALKARAQHLSAALDVTLPANFDQAAAVIEASLGPPPPVEDDPAGPDVVDADAGLRGWVVWPLTDYVARRGLDTPERALEALHTLTQRFTAEWAIRPFIVHHPALSFGTLERWTRDPSAHVRRLVSEGSRPRLPWGLQLKSLIADPSPSLPLLAVLQHDPSSYVRRSVANHLNDIAKDHPALIASWLQQHLPTASAEHRALLKHASRTLIKRGDSPVLTAWGLGRRFKGETALAVTPPVLRLGGSLTLSVQLQSTARRAQSLVIDYAVHHVKANGGSSPKVFKGWTLTLSAGESRSLLRQHAVRPITTRRYFAGRHRVELLINGTVAAHCGFELHCPLAPLGRGLG